MIPKWIEEKLSTLCRFFENSRCLSGDRCKFTDAESNQNRPTRRAMCLVACLAISIRPTTGSSLRDFRNERARCFEPNKVENHVHFLVSLASLIPESDGQSRVYALLTLAHDAEQRTNGCQNDDDGLLLALACEHTTTTRTCTLAKKSELEDKRMFCDFEDLDIQIRMMHAKQADSIEHHEIVEPRHIGYRRVERGCYFCTVHNHPDEFADGCAVNSEPFDTSSASLSRAGMPLGADLRPRAPPNDDTTKRVYCAAPALAAGVVSTEDAALLLCSSKVNSK